MNIKCLGLIVGAVAASQGNASTVAFATIGYQALSGSNVTYSMSGGTLHSGTGSSAAPIMVSFGFEHLPGIPSSLPTSVDAFMSWSATRTTGAAGDVNCGAMCSQTTTGSFTITAANPIPLLNGHSGRILLEATFTGIMNGALTGSSLNVLASHVVYHSDFFDFSNNSVSSFDFNFNSVLSTLALNGGNFRDLLGSGSAVFRASNVTAFGAAPEPSSFVLGAIALAVLGALRRRNPEKAA